ncbi:MAG: xylulokinase [Rhizobiaceae bacterium]
MYLGIDLGTSGVKALLVDDEQAIVTSANAPLNVDRPSSGWSEQNPADWIDATKKAIGSLRTSHAKQLSAVRGIGLSGQMHGATLLDASGDVLRPCMLWNDTRSFREASELDSNPEFRSISGNIVFPGFTAPKVIWVKNNEPDIFEKTSKILLPKDYLRYWLTGEFVSEMSDASGTSWLDVENRRWSHKLLDACQLDIDHMPDLVEGSAPSGHIRKDLAAEWGMNNDVVIAGGAGDNAASAVGMGTVNAEDAFVSLGTSGVLFAANDAYRPKPESAVHAFCHALPGMWHQMGVILSATDALNWYAGLVDKDASVLTSNLGEELAPPSGIIFLPYLSGERTPHNDAAIRGGFMGIDHEANDITLTRSVLEGVTFALRDNQAALESAGTRLESITAVGGGSRSIYWLKLIATVLGVQIKIPADGDFGAAFGAARLGLIAEQNCDWREICKPPATDKTINPDSRLADAYEEQWHRYRSFYSNIKGL